MDNVNYLLARAKEASSYAGVAMVVLATLHVHASADVVNAFLGLVAAAAGFAAVLIPEHKAVDAAKVAVVLSMISFGLGACSLQPADPKVTAGIVQACTDSGLFKLADGSLTIAVPAFSLPVSVLNAGVDKVCANPEKFASDISTIEWATKNLVTEARGVVF